MTNHPKHCCGDTAKIRQTRDRQRKSDLFKCGSCDSVFETICMLHVHCSEHAEGGSYFFNNITYTAFPKFVSVSVFTQVTDELIDTEVRDNTSATVCKKMKKEQTEVVIRRKTPVRQSKSQAKLNKIWVTSKRKQRNQVMTEGVEQFDKTENDTEICLDLKIPAEHLEKIQLSQDKNSAFLSKLASDDTHQNNCDVNALETEDKIKKGHVINNETSKENISSHNSSIKSRQTSRKRSRYSRANACDSNETCTGKDTAKHTGDASHEKDELTASEVLIAMSKGVSADTKNATQDQGSNDKNPPKEETENNSDHVIRAEVPESENSSMHKHKQSSSEQVGDNLGDINSNRKQRVSRVKKHGVRKASQSRNNVLTCKECGKVGGQAVMNYHKYMHMEKKNFTCETCGTSFKHPRCLQMHQKQHEEKKFKCGTCSAAFYRKQYLRTHMLKHTGEKPYMCDICGKSYREKNNLTRHIRHVHEKVRNYECDICVLLFPIMAL